MKYAKKMQLLVEGGVGWNLHFHLLKEFHWNYDVNQKATWQIQYQKPLNANTKCYVYVYIYIYTVFAIAVYLGSTLYINIYIKYPTDTINLYVSRCCWANNFAIHALRPPYPSKNNRATKSKQPRIELRINKPKTVHLPRTLIFHIWSKEEKLA